MLNRKHYKAIAEIIEDCHYGLSSCNADYYNAGRFDAARLIAIGICDYFAQDNPRCEKTNTGFNRECFMKACGLE